jgi:hypothetical protein
MLSSWNGCRGQPETEGTVLRVTSEHVSVIAVRYPSRKSSILKQRHFVILLIVACVVELVTPAVLRRCTRPVQADRCVARWRCVG